MRRRELEKRYEAAVQKAGPLAESFQEDLKELGPRAVGGFIAFIMERGGVLDRNKQLALTAVINRELDLGDGRTGQARCRKCLEILTQENVLGLPVTYSQKDGRFHLVIELVCGDECARDLVS